jgi:hypothetical protein
VRPDLNFVDYACSMPKLETTRAKTGRLDFKCLRVFRVLSPSFRCNRWTGCAPESPSEPDELFQK